MPPQLFGRFRDAAHRTLPPISVVICASGRPAHLAACLKAVLAQDHPCFEIIVVDSASSDDHVQRIAARFPVRYLVEERPGVSVARNLGAAMASYPLIAFTEADSRPDPGWLSAIAIAFEDPAVMAVTGLVLPFVLETPAQILFEQVHGGLGKGIEPRLFQRDQLSALDLIAAQQMGAGANMAFRRETLARVGLFDPCLGAGAPGCAAEDLDMFHRVVAAGLPLFYEPMAVVRHHHRRALLDLEQQLADALRGFSCYLRKLLRTGTARRSAVIATALRTGAALGWGALGLSGAPTRLTRAQVAGFITGLRQTQQPAGGTPTLETARPVHVPAGEDALRQDSTGGAV